MTCVVIVTPRMVLDIVSRACMAYQRLFLEVGPTTVITRDFDKNA